MSLVMLSAFDTRLSVAAVISGVDGATMPISIVTAKAADAMLTLPAVSIVLAMMLWTPLARVGVMLHFPPVATAVPIAVVPSNNVTVLLASAVPVNVGVVMLVMLSMLGRAGVRR